MSAIATGPPTRPGALLYPLGAGSRSPPQLGSAGAASAAAASGTSATRVSQRWVRRTEISLQRELELQEGRVVRERQPAELLTMRVFELRLHQIVGRVVAHAAGEHEVVPFIVDIQVGVDPLHPTRDTELPGDEHVACLEDERERRQTEVICAIGWVGTRLGLAPVHSTSPSACSLAACTRTSALAP